MSVGYRAVQWNRHKRVYDLVLACGVVGYLVVFFVASRLVLTGRTGPSDEVLLMRAFGTCAFLLLHVILCIGPLARLSPRFNPLLYNRRHLGVTMFLLALCHGALALGYYHGFGDANPLVSLLTNGGSYQSFLNFPFQVLGAAALVILFLMAATSHDFWLKNLTPPVWKRLHMGVYFAYGLLVLHVVLGVLQSERSAVYTGLVLGGLAVVIVLHLTAGIRELRRRATTVSGDWIDVGPAADIPESRALLVCPQGRERIAVFRHEGKLSALSNVCAHQNGPLAEGRIVDGCVTCPWHGYQYRPADGRSPPPFTERVETFRVRVDNGRVLVNPNPLPPGTPVEPASIEPERNA